MRIVLALLTASALCLSGCGGTPTTSSASSPNLLTGNWSTTTSATAGPSLQIGAYLVNNSGALSGTMYVTNSNYSSYACYPISTGQPESVPFTGTYNSTSGAVSITSSSVSSQVITINGTITPNTTALTGGTYTITGGCANGDTGTITGNEDGSFTSTTYTGSISNPSDTLTAALTQTGPNTATGQGNGLFSLSGTFTFTGTSCFASGTINGITTYVIGNYVYITVTDNDTSTLTFTGSAANYTDTTISGTYQISGGSCNGDSGNLTMSHT